MKRMSLMSLFGVAVIAALMGMTGCKKSEPAPEAVQPAADAGQVQPPADAGQTPPPAETPQ